MNASNKFTLNEIEEEGFIAWVFFIFLLHALHQTFLSFTFFLKLLFCCILLLSNSKCGYGIQIPISFGRAVRYAPTFKIAYPPSLHLETFSAIPLHKKLSLDEATTEIWKISHKIYKTQLHSSVIRQMRRQKLLLYAKFINTFNFIILVTSIYFSL